MPTGHIDLLAHCKPISAMIGHTADYRYTKKQTFGAMENPIWPPSKTTGMDKPRIEGINSSDYKIYKHALAIDLRCGGIPILIALEF